MSDEARTHFEQSKEPEVEAPQGRSVTLSITLHPNNQIEFNFPANKILAHGLLGAAQEQMTKMSLVAELQQSTQPANGGGLGGLLKKMGRG